MQCVELQEPNHIDERYSFSPPQKNLMVLWKGKYKNIMKCIKRYNGNIHFKSQWVEDPGLL